MEKYFFFIIIATKSWYCWLWLHKLKSKNDKHKRVAAIFISANAVCCHIFFCTCRSFKASLKKIKAPVPRVWMWSTTPIKKQKNLQWQPSLSFSFVEVCHYFDLRILFREKQMISQNDVEQLVHQSTSKLLWQTQVLNMALEKCIVAHPTLVWRYGNCVPPFCYILLRETLLLFCMCLLATFDTFPAANVLGSLRDLLSAMK